ncbi:N-alpha-acetyltransferase 38, NatC auxiliary subunit-like isoform X2 [Pollicipes pollicipes]|uniref:N-alpha-acetyltransferase 38, NatC auxiliary subunit-like isoform X2 n=1 Tax=Pollicipes pollicipes TaxID=41117 RepID=UPI0018856777|nr:N-alpha-acetyltransferase 38, NatC auxiliary subunit-like isoform X2 [Pollicipes pollicipes]
MTTLLQKMSSGRVPNGDFYNNLVDMTLKSEEIEAEKQRHDPRQHPPKQPKMENQSPGRLLLESYLNKTMRIVMTDGRSLMGIFWCTDRDANVILGNCMEHMPPREDGSRDEPRPLGLAMIPGRHIVTMHLDQLQHVQPDHVT